jgi:hypothetical protein
MALSKLHKIPTFSSLVVIGADQATIYDLQLLICCVCAHALTHTHVHVCELMLHGLYTCI